ncbi:hypothetical protein KM043_017646 [Ampulex compressa]|nr:hypothetical protein KM043_017646 [Ampulex compressa]
MKCIVPIVINLLPYCTYMHYKFWSKPIVHPVFLKYGGFEGKGCHFFSVYEQNNFKLKWNIPIAVHDLLPSFMECKL